MRLTVVVAEGFNGVGNIPENLKIVGVKDLYLFTEKLAYGPNGLVDHFAKRRGKWKGQKWLNLNQNH